VTGLDDGREFTYGKNETKHQAKKSYEFAMKSPHVSDKVKKTLRIVELVEKDITSELIVDPIVQQCIDICEALGADYDCHYAADAIIRKFVRS
jgi:ribosomal protein L11